MGEQSRQNTTRNFNFLWHRIRERERKVCKKRFWGRYRHYFPDTWTGTEGEKLLPRVSGAWLLNGVWIGWLDLLHLHTQLVTTCNTALSLLYTLYSSPLHARVLGLQ
jgi:hypothetical protein